MEIADYIVAEDRELVRLALAGDDVAFEYLFDRYREAILRLFVQRLGGTDRADDPLPETLLTVYIHLHPHRPASTLRQRGSPLPPNPLLHFVRKRQEELPIDERFASPPSPSPTPEESFINRQQRTQLEHYLEQLSPRYRQLIRMRFFDEYSYEEIATKLGLPLGTVKTQIHRAREQMCRLITRGGE